METESEGRRASGIDLEKLARDVSEMKEAISALYKESQEPKAVALWHCSEEGCRFVTDDMGAYIGHVVDEKMKGVPLVEETAKRHVTVEEFLECPDCFPKIEKEMLEHGWKKPEKAEAKKKGWFSFDLPPIEL